MQVPPLLLLVPSGQVVFDQITFVRLVVPVVMAPLRLALAKSAPFRLAPLRLAPLRLALAKSAPFRLAPLRLQQELHQALRS
jgi:hypothetical protein